MIKVKALKDNKTMNYTKGKIYDARISQQCYTILFIDNDLGDSVIVNKFDFTSAKERKGLAKHELK